MLLRWRVISVFFTVLCGRLLFEPAFVRGTIPCVDDLDRHDIRAAVTGDHDAYARLVRRYESQVSRLMWRFCRDVGVCEQLVQDVFVAAYFSLAGYRSRAPFFHWLSRIATRVGYRFWKTQARKQEQLLLRDLDAVVPSSQQDDVGAGEAAEIMEALLAQLPASDRLVLTLVYLERCSMKDVSARTGWNLGMVKMRAYRARQRLKKIAIKENILERLGWIS